MLASKKIAGLVCILAALILLASSPQPSSAQFIPCRIVNLNLVPPTLVQAGQPFQVTSNLTVSCDPSILPVIRVDLIDAASSKTISTASVPYYTYSSSFTVSVVNQATAPELPGSWALQVQAYVLNAITGQAAASTSQLFQVNVSPYTGPVTLVTTNETSTQALITQAFSSSSTSTQFLQSTTTLPTLTESSSSTEPAFITESTGSGSVASGLVLPAAILLVGLLVFALLAFASRRGKQRAALGKYCTQCGGELKPSEKYCTNCGAEQTK